MIPQVRTAAEKERRARSLRDQSIRAAHAAGHSLREIAEAAGLSHSAIAKIVARPQPDSL